MDVEKVAKKLSADNHQVKSNLQFCRKSHLAIKYFFSFYSNFVLLLVLFGTHQCEGKVQVLPPIRYCLLGRVVRQKRKPRTYSMCIRCILITQKTIKYSSVCVRWLVGRTISVRLSVRASLALLKMIMCANEQQDYFCEIVARNVSFYSEELCEKNIIQNVIQS